MNNRDLDILRTLRKEISPYIEWNRLFEACEEFIQDKLVLVLSEGGEFAKDGKPLLNIATQEELDLVGGDGGEYLLALLKRKVLGGIKQRVRAVLHSYQLNYSAPDEPEEEECTHPELLSKYLYRGKKEVYQKICVHCGEILEERKTGRLRKGKKKGRSEKKRKEKCAHHSARWVRGQEGHVAECPSCGLNPLPEVESYPWVRCGLEPPGDDPSKDEVTVLEYENY